jgi:hypothetical protein
MTLRERIADWISGGRLSNEMTAAHILCLYNADSRAEAANIAAQRDEAIARAEVAEKQARILGRNLEAAEHNCAMLEIDNRNGWANSVRFSAALRAILTARNITEARKIAKQALGEAE